jgi:hypothetical protein
MESILEFFLKNKYTMSTFAKFPYGPGAPYASETDARAAAAAAAPGQQIRVGGKMCPKAGEWDCDEEVPYVEVRLSAGGRRRNTRNNRKNRKNKTQNKSRNNRRKNKRTRRW